MDKYLAFAKKIARQGGAMMQDAYDTNVAVELKSDKSPVTEVDKAINQMIIDAVAVEFPEHGVMGEEADSGNGEEEFKWLTDPIDSTKSFIIGIPNSTCILALTKNSEIILTVIYHPFEDKLYYAVKGKGAYCNDKPIRVNNTPLNNAYVLVEVSAVSLYDKLLQAGASLEPCAGAGYRCILIAAGKASATVKTHYDFHDVGPGSLLIEEAGGKVTDFDGKPIIFDRQRDKGIIISNGVSHESILAAIQ